VSTQEYALCPHVTNSVWNLTATAAFDSESDANQVDGTLNV